MYQLVTSLHELFAEAWVPPGPSGAIGKVPASVAHKAVQAGCLGHPGTGQPHPEVRDFVGGSAASQANASGSGGYRAWWGTNVRPRPTRLARPT
jgi:hypothetical protein